MIPLTTPEIELSDLEPDDLHALEKLAAACDTPMEALLDECLRQLPGGTEPLSSAANRLAINQCVQVYLRRQMKDFDPGRAKSAYPAFRRVIARVAERRSDRG